MALQVLIVDDSAVMRAMILRSLRMAGVSLETVHEAANGQEGLDCLNREAVDVAFVDVNMPVMDGAEMIEQMRTQKRLAKLPVVIISTESSERRLRELQQFGVHFVHKPFTPETIRDVVLAITGDNHE